jgi:hypothetical protein
MRCKKCGQKNDVNFKFCDGCGASLEKETNARLAEPISSSRVARVNAVETSKFELQLQTWAGFRWLFATNYGRLSISEFHLNHEINKLWAFNFYAIIVKLFNWGFDVFTSMRVSRGTTLLKSISSVRIFALDWIVWKGHFLFVWSGGLPDIYFFSSKQLDEVEEFVVELKMAAAESKIFVTK